MATFKDLAIEYFDRLVKSSNPVFEFEKILKEIKGLVYSSSNQSISDEDKAKIVLLIIENLEKKYSKYLSATGPEPIFEQQEIQKAFSNDNYLDLIEYIRARTK